jgi:hypothetical protein
MVGRAFILLKAGCTGPKSTEQAEIRLAILPTILWIGRIGDGKFPRKGVGMRAMVVLGLLPWDMANCGAIIKTVI